MPETITLSFSQCANQLTTHFNNTQSDRLFRDPSRSDAFIHILPKSNQNSRTISNLYPRSILYDYLNGSGALDPYTYFEEKPEIKTSFEIIQTLPSISMTEFQKNVQNGIIDGNGINGQRTSYWSDFSKVTYDPRAVITHPTYVYDEQTGEGRGKNLPDSKFQLHEIGVESFNNVNKIRDSVDDIVRKMFENSGNVNQLNSVVELDSSWSGVCSESLKYIIDDQLDGRSSKIVLWSLQRDTKYVDNMNLVTKMDRIEKLITFANLNLSGIVMMNLDIDVGSNSLWEKTAFLSVLYDQFNDVELNCDLTEIMYKLTDSSSKSFINNIDTLWDDESIQKMGANGIFITQQQRKPHIFSKSIVKSIEDCKDFSKCSDNTPKYLINEYKLRHEYEYVDSMPEIMKNRKPLASSLSVDDTLKTDFTNMKNYVSRYCRNDKREELKDTLDNLREAYINGFEFSDEEDDY